MNLQAVMNWFSSAPFLHVAGIAAIATLMGVGVISSTEGLPLLTGLIGLGIQTTTGGDPAAPVAAPRPVAAPTAPPAG